MRTLEELVDQHDPALPLLQKWSNDPAGNRGILLSPSDVVRADTLRRLQVTTRSMLGAVVYETGGVAIANGLIRLLGSGMGWSLREANEDAGCPLDGSYPDLLVIADDMLGGLFAINGGRFGTDGLGQVFHLAADDIVWLPLDVGYADFVLWCLTGDLSGIYKSMRHLQAYKTQPRPAFEKAYSFYPFLWTKEGKGAEPGAKVIDAGESLRLRIKFCGFATG